jgi:predicted transcriptional regulator
MGKVKNREQLIERIKQIDDQNVIDEIYRLLDVNIDESVYQLNEEQKKAIQEGREQIERGEGIPSDQVFKDIDEWLNK